jgi:glycosyltransferase involved in cell wall biosynthesis
VRFSVIITTFNRAAIVTRAVESVLSQEGVELELIVVDDGSTDWTPMVLNEIIDPRVITLRRENGGLSAARNTGIARASGDWIAFLDDDDIALPGWLAGLASLIDERAGAVCCAAEYRTPEDEFVGLSAPGPMGALFHHTSALILAGTFAVRSDLCRVIGGYDERIICSHQSELWMRLVPAMLERQLEIRTTNRPLVRLEWRESRNRPLKDPARLYQGVGAILEKHRDSFARDPRARTFYNGVLGVSAARLGLWSQARSAFYTSARAKPLRIRPWLQLAIAYIPPVARCVWNIPRNQPSMSNVL